VAEVDEQTGGEGDRQVDSDRVRVRVGESTLVSEFVVVCVSLFEREKD
jgi:hypothetical protein